jgi:diacylglycerol kinase (ATP)
MRIDLVVNSHARRYQADATLLERVRRVAAGRAELHLTRSLDEMDRIAGELAARGTDLVILSGGDGTLMAGITALSRSFGPEHIPPVAPIPGGTAGTVARNWGVSGDPASCLACLLGRPPRTVLRPTLRVVAEGEGPVGAGSVERIGFIVGTGLVANFFELYYQRGAPGYRGSARMVARIFAESFVGGPLARRVLEPLPCALAVDGHELAPRAWSLVCAAVVRNLGIHMLLNHRAGEDPDRPHLVASPLPPRRLGPLAPWVLAGRPLPGVGNVDRLVGELELRFPTVGAYVLDGELLRASRVVVTAGPRVPVATAAERGDA